MRVKHPGDSSVCKHPWGSWGRWLRKEGRGLAWKDWVALCWETQQVNFGRSCCPRGPPSFVVIVQTWGSDTPHCDKVPFVSWPEISAMVLNLRRILLWSQIEDLLAVLGLETHFCLSYIGVSNGKESASNSGDPSSIPGLRGSTGERNGNPLQHSWLGNPMDRGSWWATVYGVPKNWTQLHNWHFL